MEHLSDFAMTTKSSALVLLEEKGEKPLRN